MLIINLQVMKRTVIVLGCILFATVCIFGQNKKDLENQVTELELFLDSLHNDYHDLSAMHKSTSKELNSYQNMYEILEEKLLPYDSNPADLETIIDSLNNSRDLIFESMMAESETLKGKIINLANDNTKLEAENVELQAEIELQKAEIEELNARPEQPTNSQYIVTDEQFDALLKIKDLLDSDILTKEEFDERKKLILGN